MNAEIISCGTELLLGYHVDTNSAFISKSLSHIGIDVFRHTTVGDNKERLAGAINEALLRADIVIITGGLGPTVDDITMVTLANVTKRDLVFNKAILDGIKSHFKDRAFKLPKDALKQALIPRGASIIKNRVGTAPGLIIKDDKKYLIALPGPSREFIPMLEKDVIPYLKKVRTQKWAIRSKTLKLIGMPEARVNEKAKSLLNLSGETTVGIYTHLGRVELRITSKAQNDKKAITNIKSIERKIKKIFKDAIYGADNDTLESVVGEILKKRKKKLAIAESCTGGGISSFITDIPGSSKYFLMGIVAYSNDVKANTLKINKKIIKEYGAVSKEVAKSMAENVREIAGSDIGLGITGIAGPTGEKKNKPIGLVYIALSIKKKTIVKELRFFGTRKEVRLQASQEALNLLRLNI